MDHFDEPRAEDIFRGKSDNYSQFRPRYPEALISLLENQISFSPLDTVADIGSGTGILSRLFLEHGNVVYGVEPNDEMRGVSSTVLRALPNFHAVKGTAENTGLGDEAVDLIVSGQAFHWFDPELARVEFKRILNTQGNVALVWNDRVQGGSGFNPEYERLCINYSPKYHSSGSTVLNEGVLKKFFTRGHHEFVLDNYQELTLEGVRGRYFSASYAIDREDSNYQSLMRKMEEIFRKHQKNGVVRLVYQTKIYLGKL